MRIDDAFQALVELAASRHNAFHSTEAADMVPPHRLRRAANRGVLTPLGPRIWSVSALGSPPGQALRAATLGTSAGAACHRGSGWLHGWFENAPIVADIWVPGHGRRISPPVRQHRAAAVNPGRDITEVDGIRTLNAAATLCLMGRVETDEVIENCLDVFLQTHSHAWLVETLDRLWTDNGAGPAALRRVLNHPARRLGLVESPFERRVQRTVADADLPPIVLQHQVSVGRRRYRIDLAMPTIKLGVESHGRRFHRGRRAEEADNQRDMALAGVGWQLLYVTWDQLQDPSALRNRIGAAARARLVEPRSASKQSKPARYRAGLLHFSNGVAGPTG
ncbi:MAG: DUF559 domain-containing protein [Acidimicrobiia bacterium]|nr:DUF559 domain-containing protein [Acidimicrobiia bacterium]